jgi:hypothetical protein
MKAKFSIAFVIVVVVVFASVITVLGGPADGLRAELKIEVADIGVPGITKMYEARLINHSSWPIRVHYCDFVDDAMTHGEEVAYTVERWDALAHEWRTVVRANGQDFCRPYPLGIVRSKLTSRLLWPGQSLATGEEATAARDGFSIGDTARFVIFTAPGQNQTRQIATGEFVIDEHRTTDSPIRVKH